MLSELRFGAFLSYSPRGESAPARRSRKFVRALKEDRFVTNTETASSFLARRLQEELSRTELASFFDPAAVLVPMPRSSLLLPNALWPASSLALALARNGLGSRVLQLLKRIEAVPKSAFAKTGQRPSPQRHFETIKVEGSVEEPSLLFLIDDVVTKGSTLIGAASRLSERYPDAEIRAFAAVRTLGLLPDIDQIIDPCVGTIRLVGSEVVREP